MNQILSVENTKKEKKKKEKSPIEIKSIIRFFSISLIIFGVLMIGSGSYSMYKDSQEAGAKIKPTIHIEEISQTEINLRVTHNKALSNVEYDWNNGDKTQIPCEGKRSVEQRIEIPSGENTLNIYATDINGQVTTDSRIYDLPKDIEINIEVEGNNIKVTAEGKEQLSYLTYRWNEEEEIRVDINDISIEQLIEIPKGLNTLTVIAVDINNQTETKEQEIKGVTKPKLEITTDGSENFIIKASDEEGLKRLEFTVNGEEKYFLNLDGMPELEYKYPIRDGETRLEVTVYNQSDVTETSKVKVTR